ncbi:MAG: hypothetical protein QXQ57_08635 [Sulfolobales archaeon]
MDRQHHSINICEGYYLELIDGSIWAVKGCCHDGERIAAVPRLVGGKKYKGYGEAMDIAARIYRSYFVRPPFTAREIPMIPLRDVKRVISPSKIPMCSSYTDLHGIAREIIRILDSATGKSWLITGSLLYCAPDDMSDIDVITYDADQKDLRVIFKLIEQGIFRKPSYYEALKEALESIEGVDIQLRISKILNGINTLYYNGKRVTIQLVRCDPIKMSKICSEKISSTSYAAILRVKDRYDGYSSPYLYSLEVMKVFRGPLSMGEELYAYSHRVRYASLARGDEIACSGVVEIGVDGAKYINLDLGLCSKEYLDLM